MAPCSLSSSVRRLVGLAAVGVIFASVGIQPAGAHITRKVGHAWKHLKPKALALITWGNLQGKPAGFADGTDNDTTYSAGTGLTLNGTTFSLTSPAWLLGGNAGTTAGTDFLGTADDEALELRVNGQRVLLLEPTETTPNVVAGFSENSATAGVVGAAIGGGGADERMNRVTDDYGTVAGGQDNQAGDDAGNTGDRSYATVGGGSSNIANGVRSTIGGGEANTATDTYATVGGGGSNNALALRSTVGGGSLNNASGQNATIPGGTSNTADGDDSFAAGFRANIAATHDGTFLFSDGNGFDFSSAAANEFAVRSTGGARVVTAIDAGTGAPTAGVKLDSGDTAWEVLSDRASKENVVTVAPTAVLAALTDVPISMWNYKAQDASIRHIGPMSQDFHAVFGLSDDARYISPIDTDGVALAAIQGLNEKVEALGRGAGARGFPLWAFALGALSAFGLVAFGAGLGLVFVRRWRLA